ncbi:polysaccharide pyruvyl transferase family protein [Microbacterium sp. P01]|uniref:polysaccharide pyruvyl transferase family protein n=1 Tax=unclassified Microbacterium TaxID=2609290 RepID=UPI00366CDDB2
MNNFGDLIGPLLVARIVSELGLTEPADDRRLVAVGSIMKLTLPGDTVWGAGVNGKSKDTGGAPHLDVRSVRGPLTRDLLVGAGTAVPEIYGDPALLWSRFWPREHYTGSAGGAPQREVAVVPNFHDRRRARGPLVVDPLRLPHAVISDIASSAFVCGSSLHGIVIAESFGIPARLIRSHAEPAFKYDDYYSGTGRTSYTTAETVEEAISMGGESPPDFDGDSLLASFPRDLWP